MRIEEILQIVDLRLGQVVPSVALVEVTVVQGARAVHHRHGEALYVLEVALPSGAFLNGSRDTGTGDGGVDPDDGHVDEANRRRAELDKSQESHDRG